MTDHEALFRFGDGPDPRGLTDQARSWRRHLLDTHADELIAFFRRSAAPDSVGFTIDVTEGKGRVLGKFVIASQENVPPQEAEARLDRLIRDRRNEGMAATVNLVVPFEAAKRLVAPFNPDSVRNLEELQHGRPANAHVVIAVGKHGNTYGYLVVDQGHVVHDGPHRVDTSWADKLTGLGWHAGIFKAEDAHSQTRQQWRQKAQDRAKKKAERKRKHK